MKFLVFADFHYDRDFMGGTREKLHAIQRRAEEESCDFIIHAGDFIHGWEESLPIAKEYSEFHIPSYHVFGNHDTDHCPYEEMIKNYSMPSNYYFFDVDGFRIIALDPNYYYVDGEYVHYSMKNYFAHGSARDHLPPEQLQWLKVAIDTAPGPCLLISHESFERDAGGVQNLSEVRAIINEANEKKKNSVLMCMNGHYHRDSLTIIDGVLYFDVNSVSYDWLEQRHDLYPEELCSSIKYLSHTVVFNDPLYAVVTVEGTHVKIEGTETTMFMGVTREMTGNPKVDKMGRPVVPRIQSLDITL